MSSIRRSIAFAVLTVVVLAPNARAQDDIRSKMTITVPSGLSSEPAHFPRGAPGTSTGSPIAFGANYHDAYVGIGYQSPLRYSNDADGGATIGAGLGNSTDAVGLDISLNVLSTIRSGIGNRMGLSGKLHHIFDGNWGVAVGVQGILLNGRRSDDPDAAIFGVVSKVFDLRTTWGSYVEGLTLSLGAGNEGFRSENDVIHNNSTVGIFGSAALRVIDRFSIIADWMQDLSIGVSVVPFKDFPLAITPAIADLTGNAGTHALPGQPGYNSISRPRFTLGAGFAIKY